jgi:hypothetical protein
MAGKGKEVFSARLQAIQSLFSTDLDQDQAKLVAVSR